MATPARTSEPERGRREKKDRTDRSLSAKSYSTTVVVKTHFTSPGATRPGESGSKSPRLHEDRIGGLFTEDNEVVIYDVWENEGSPCTAASASVLESEAEEISTLGVS